MKDGFLRDPQGRAVILHGANLAGAQKNPPYWGFHTAADYARLRDEWGMNAIRFVVTWAAIEPEEGQYDDAFLDQVAMRMQWARDANLLVVIDMHDDVYGEGFVQGGGDGAPKWSCDASNYASFQPLDQWYLNDLTGEVTACYDHFWQSSDLYPHYEEAWKRLAARVASFDNVIGFDPINEPYWGSTPVLGFEPSILQPFYEKLVPAVRSVAPSLVAFLEPSTFRNLGGNTRLVPFPFEDVVYSPHSYDRDAESGVGFDPSHRDPLIANIDALAGEATSLNAALFIGEYGGMANTPGIVDYMTAQYDGAGKHAASSMYWSYDESDNYGLLNVDGSEKTILTNVVARPYPERVAGTPSSYAFDAASSTFTFSYAPDASIAAPTIVSIPDRVYPNGYQVECGGCAYDKSAGSLAITKPPSGDTVTVTVHP
ncbi:MAG: cellulase family glycosylhydrolase [Polyangiaceae bacterium]